nr:MAG TPA: hypothetical protein [Caudoviricetes sp.]
MRKIAATISLYTSTSYPSALNLDLREFLMFVDLIYEIKKEEKDAMDDKKEGK